MTNEQRQQITKFRNLGYGYSAIAGMTGLSKDNVKAFCIYHNLGGARGKKAGEAPKTEDLYVRCLTCGKALEPTPGVKKRKFCSPMCRQTWWNSHPDQVNRKALYSYTCPSCGRSFTAYGNNHRKYCSRDCFLAERFGRR